MKTLIVENERAAVDLLESLILEFAPNLEIVGQSGTIEEATRLYQHLNPELLFLDIELDDGHSFEFLKEVDLSNTKVVFTTAYDQYALKSFDYNTIDYLLKPYSPKQFKRAIQKLKPQNNSSEMIDQLESIINGYAQDQSSSKLSITSEKGITLVNQNDIIRIEADKNYAFLHLTNGSQVVASKSLSSFEEKLLNAKFKRVHKSHIVNFDYVNGFTFEDGGFLNLENGDKIPVSRRKKTEIIQFLKE